MMHAKTVALACKESGVSFQKISEACLNQEIFYRSKEALGITGTPILNTLVSIPDLRDT